MNLPRFYCPDLSPRRIALAAEESRHAITVLRLGVGDSVQLFDGRGRIAIGCIVEATRGCIVVKVEGDPVVVAPRKPALTLCTAVPRAARQPFLFEKCTELGVAKIVPTVFQRSTVRPDSKTAQKWRRTVVEAGKQCGCDWLPRIADPADLNDTLHSRSEKVRLVGSLVNSLPLAELLGQIRTAEDVAIWIGPEGGMTDEELDVLEGIGARHVRLGPNILRVETAAIAAAAAIALWKDAMSTL